MNENVFKILLVEDDSLDQMAFKRLVDREKLPYDCTIAGSVSDARKVLESKKFDVIISDYSLGDGTAMDVLVLAKETPVILVTGAGDEETAIKVWHAGACDYLTKDVDRNYLKTISISIEKTIRQHELKIALDRKQKNLQAIFDAAPVCMLLLAEDFTIMRVNEAVKVKVGREYLEIIGQLPGNGLGCVNSLSNETRQCGCSTGCNFCSLQKTIKEVFASGKAIHGVEIPLTLMAGDNKIVTWFNVNAEPVNIDCRQCAVVAMDDITSRKEAEKKLAEAVELKSQFISTVSHELRTPLTCIKEAVEAVLEGIAGEVNDKQRNFLNIVKRNMERLANLINDVLDFQRLESGRSKLELSENDIRDVIKSVEETMAIIARQKGLNFAVELDGNLPKVWFDSNKIIQVLTNLVSNSIKFTPQGGSVTVSMLRQGDELVMRVRDTGMGIPKESLPKIGDRFYRVPRPGKEIKGTGLGLSIVRKIVDLHRGRMEIESEIDKGTTFTVFMPLDIRVSREILPEQAYKTLEASLSCNLAKSQ